MQTAWPLSCPTIHGNKHFHLSDVPLAWQTKNPTYIFIDKPKIESFVFICPTSLVSLWSFKQGYVLCLSWFHLVFLQRILLQRMSWIYMRNPLKRPNKSGKGCFCTTAICKYKVAFKLKLHNLQMFSRPSI